MRQFTLRVVFTIALLCVAMSVQAAIYISGSALSPGTRKPVAGVTVSVYSGSIDRTTQAVAVCQTTTNGAFVLSVATPGDYTLVGGDITHPPFSSMLIHVPPAGLTEVNLSFTPAPPNFIQVQLLTPGGKPAVNAVTDSVMLLMRQRPGGQEHRVTMCVSFPSDVPANNTGVIQLSLPRYANRMTGAVESVAIGVRCPAIGYGEVILPNVPDKTVEVKLNAGDSLDGVVMEPGDTPQPGAQISLMSFSVNPMRRMMEPAATTMADANGRFRLPNLRPGRYEVRYTNRSGQSHFHTVVLGDQMTSVRLTGDDSALSLLTGEPTRREFGPQMCVVPSDVPVNFNEPMGGPTVQIRTMFAKGEPAPGVVVRLMNGPNLLIDGGTTDVTGRVTLHQGMAGTDTVLATLPGYLPATTTTTLQPTRIGEGGASDLFMVPQPCIHLRVLDMHSEPVGLGTCQAQIMVHWPAGGMSFGPVAQNGAVDWSVPAVTSLPGGETDCNEANKVEIRVRSSGGVAHTVLNRWPTGPVQIVLQPGRTIEGTVKLANGQPAPGGSIRVEVYDQKLRWPVVSSLMVSYVMSNKEGRFQASGLTDGDYSITAFIPGVGVRRRIVTVDGPVCNVAISAADPLFVNQNHG